MKILWFPLFLLFVGTFFTSAFAQSESDPAEPPPTASVSGCVTLDGKPVAGVRVEVLDNYEETVGAGRTGPDGTYRIGGLKPGKCTVRAQGGAAVQEESPQTRNRGAFRLEAGRTTEGIDIRLTPGGVITGRVTDRKGRPLTDIPVWLLAIFKYGKSSLPYLVNNAIPVRPSPLSTDDQGRYRAFGIPPGRYLLCTRNGPKQPYVLHPDATTLEKAQVIEVGSGRITEGIDIVVPDPPQVFSVIGRMTRAETGAPVVGKPVMILQDNQPGQERFSEMTQTDRDGWFRVDELLPGTYKAFLADNAYPVGHPEHGLYGGPVAFEIVDGDPPDVLISVRPGMPVSGFIEFQGDPAPVQDFEKWSVVLVPENIEFFRNPRNGSFRRDGSFQVPGLPPGSYKVMIYGSSESEFAVEVVAVFVNGVKMPQNLMAVENAPITDVRVLVRIFAKERKPR